MNWIITGIGIGRCCRSNISPLDIEQYWNTRWNDIDYTSQCTASQFSTNGLEEGSIRFVTYCVGMGGVDDAFAKLVSCLGALCFVVSGARGKVEFLEVWIESDAQERIYRLGAGGELLEEGGRHGWERR
jgi:hypothetical protein